MNKEQKYISQPLAKKIYDKAKEKGFELPESEYSWMRVGNIFNLMYKCARGYRDQTDIFIRDDIFESNTHYPAYDIAELWEIIPESVNVRSYWDKIWIGKTQMGENRVQCGDDQFFERDKNLAEAMGKMFYYLLDNDLLK